MRRLVCLAVVVVWFGCGGESSGEPGAAGQGVEGGQATDWPVGSADSGASGLGGAAGSASEVDPFLLSDCESDAVTTGGEWYALGDSEEVATITPSTGLSTPFAVTDGSYDGSHACHVSGEVPGPLPEDDPRKDPCGERLYPSAAVGFGFCQGNSPFDVAGKAGIAFVAKSGIDDYVVRVSVPQTTTTMPRYEQRDLFDKTCLCAQEGAVSTPVQRRSCDAHYGLYLELGTEWQLCAVYFTDLTAPSWGGDEGFAPNKVIELQWEMQQPPAAEETIPFDIWLDDVKWITDEQLGSTAPSGLPATSGCVPLDNGA